MLLACIWPMIVFAPSIARWTDITCHPISKPFMMEKDVGCACQCTCQEGNPTYPGCVNPIDQGGLIRSSQCEDNPCEKCGKSQAYCKRCYYEEYILDVLFKYTDASGKTYISSYYVTIKDNKAKADAWFKRHSHEFPCSYLTDDPKETPTYGHLHQRGVIITAIASVVMFLLLVCIISTSYIALGRRSGYTPLSNP